MREHEPLTFTSESLAIYDGDEAYKFLRAFKAQGRASMPGGEGFLTLTIRMRVSPEPMEKNQIQMEGSLTFLATAQVI